MADSANCEICYATIEGHPFTLSALTEPPALLAVCETCASSKYIRLRNNGLNLEVRRDDYIRADRERLDHALDTIQRLMEDVGWSLEGVAIEARSDAITEPCAGV